MAQMMQAILLVAIFWTTLAQAQSLEHKLRQRLDRIFDHHEYLIDIRPAALAQDPAKQGLPGFEMLGALNLPSFLQPPSQRLSENVGDILLVVDRKVSRDRVQLAQEVIKRVLEADGYQNNVPVQVKQQDIRAPIEAPPPPPAPPMQPPAPSTIETMEKHRSFLARMLFVLWLGLVSMMAFYIILRRILGVGSSPSLSPAQQASIAAPQRQNEYSADGNSSTAQNRNKAASKDELYSKDQATMNLIKEMMTSAQEEPHKIAKVITKLVASGHENAKYIAMFMKNCDIKTTEKICALIHPSDLETIFKNKVEDFDPFSDENLQVLELVRHELALQAAEVVIKEKPEPLGFLKNLSSEDLALVLENEDIRTIAFASTQIPSHRLAMFYAKLPAETYSKVLLEISRIKSPSLYDFNDVKEKLDQKSQTLAINLFSEKAKIITLTQLVQTAPLAEMQITLAMGIRSDNLDIYKLLRKNIILASDLNYFSSRVCSVLIQSIDADLLACVLSAVDAPFNKLFDNLPGTYTTVLQDMMSRTYEDKRRIEAWAKVQSSLSELIDNGIVGESEIEAAIAMAEEYLDNPEKAQEQDDPDANLRFNAA
jgi:hypothetical protein